MKNNLTQIQQVGEIVISTVVIAGCFYGLVVARVQGSAQTFLMIAGYAVLQSWFSSALLGRLLGQGTSAAAAPGSPSGNAGAGQ